jgi:hypothetical protein
MSIIDGDTKDPAAQGGGAAPPAAPEWTAGLPPELQQHVTAKGYKGVADVVTAHMHAEKLVGADKIAVPKDGVWDEAAKIKLGIPTDVKGYKIDRPKLPDGLPYDEKFESTALAVAHEAGLSNAQAQKLVEFWAKSQGDAFAGIGQDTEAARASTVGELQKEGGKAYDDRVAFASRAAREFGGEPLLAFLNESGAGNSPHLIRAFAKIGEMLREDKISGGRPSGMALTPDQARVEANKLMQTDAYRKRDHAEHADVVRRVTQLFESQYPES